nr:PREDICTED: nucleolar protein 16 [Opisthocomus hoazin]
MDADAEYLGTRLPAPPPFSAELGAAPLAASLGPHTRRCSGEPTAPKRKGRGCRRTTSTNPPGKDKPSARLRADAGFTPHPVLRRSLSGQSGLSERRSHRRRRGLGRRHRHADALATPKVAQREEALQHVGGVRAPFPAETRCAYRQAQAAAAARRTDPTAPFHPRSAALTRESKALVLTKHPRSWRGSDLWCHMEIMGFRRSGMEAESGRREQGKKIVLKPYVVNEMEYEASLPEKKSNTLSRDLIDYVQYMIQNHGENYKEMARDEKNYYQDTPKQIKRKINVYKNFYPEEYKDFIASLKQEKMDVQ